MSSPSHRRQRSSQSGTPRRSSRRSDAGTPRQDPPSELASSPVFYQSSSPGRNGAEQQNGNNGEVSSPLRHMTDSQSTGANAPTPSSPLQHMSDTQSIGDQATPRASRMGLLAGGTYNMQFSIF